MDITNPIENPALIAAFDTMVAQPTQANEAALLAAVRAAQYISPVKFDPEPSPDTDGNATLGANTTISFALMSHPSGGVWVPAFTDWDEMRKWTPDPAQKTLVLTIEDLASIVEKGQHQGLTINPFGQNLMFTPEQLSRILAGNTDNHQRMVVEEETQVKLGEPEVYPHRLTEALAAHMRNQPAISRAWLRLMEMNGEKSYLVVVDFDGDRTSVFNEIGRVAGSILQQGEFINLVPLDEKFGRDAAAEVSPFFEREG